MNLAGFRSTDGFAWGRLANWRVNCWRLSYCLQERYSWLRETRFEEEEWGNVTGALSAEWMRYSGGGNEKTGGHLNLRKIAPAVNWAFWDPEDWTMNVTGNEGRVMLRIDGKASLEIEVEQEPDTLMEQSELGERWEIGISRQMALVREVAATMTVQENNNDDGWEMRVYGVHWPRTGVLLMTTTSEKFAGIFGLPHLNGGKDYFRTSQRLLTATVGKTLEGMKKAVWFDPWIATPGATTDATRPVPHCEYVVYFQMHPRENNMLEASKMSMVIFSPDCGFILGPPECVVD